MLIQSGQDLNAFYPSEQKLNPIRLLPPLAQRDWAFLKNTFGIEQGTAFAKGGMGEVYRGTYNGTTVAVKLPFTEIKNQASTQPLITAVNEGIIWKKLEKAKLTAQEKKYFLEAHLVTDQHSNVALYSEWFAKSGKEPNTPAPALWDRIRNGELGPQNPVFTKKVILQILEAQTALEKAGIVHRDLSTGNILINDNGDIKIIDFGFSSPEGLLSPHLKLDAIGRRGYGTLTHAPIAQLRGKNAKASDDRFAISFILWEALSGTSLPAAESPAPPNTVKRPIVFTGPQRHTPALTADAVNASIPKGPAIIVGSKQMDSAKDWSTWMERAYGWKLPKLLAEYGREKINSRLENEKEANKRQDLVKSIAQEILLSPALIDNLEALKIESKYLAEIDSAVKNLQQDHAAAQGLGELVETGPHPSSLFSKYSQKRAQMPPIKVVPQKVGPKKIRWWSPWR